LIARYKKLFRSSAEAGILAVYGLVDLIVLLMSTVGEHVKALLLAMERDAWLVTADPEFSKVVNRRRYTRFRATKGNLPDT
jgi:hypothetical protein